MAKSEKVIFQGKGSWAINLFTLDTKFGFWSILLHFDKDSYNRFMKLKETSDGREGIKNEVQMDDDGHYHKFKRPLKKEYKDRNGANQTIIFEPPVILDAEGKPWDKSIMIGNGSDLTVQCELYHYKVPFRTGVMGSAIRMEGARVDHLVPYERKDLTVTQEKIAGNLDVVPKQLF